MSAFLVDDFTIHRALMGRSYAMHARGYDMDEMTATGRKWLAMNIEALRQRYGANAFEGDTPDPAAYTFRHIDDHHPADYLKALCCLQYQCAEGDVPETWAEYADLTTLIGDCAIRVIHDNVPAYDAAPWDGEHGPTIAIVAA